MEIIKFIAVIGITLMIVEYNYPIELVKKYFKLRINDEPKELYKTILQKLINCALCTGFWIGLLFYFNFYYAIVIAFIAEISYKLLERLFNTLK